MRTLAAILLASLAATAAAQTRRLEPLLRGSVVVPGQPRRNLVDVLEGNNTITATGATAGRTLADRFADVVNVKDHGATGNGTTDDTSAIAAALTAGAGKEVRFTDGAVYLVSAPLTPASGTKVTGKARVIAKNVGTFNAILDLSARTNVTVADLEIDGRTNAGGTVGALFGVKVTGGSNVVLRDVNVHDTYGECIRFDGGTGHAVLGGRAVDCGRASSTEDHGIALLAVTGALSHVRVEGVHVEGANRKGIAGYSTGGLALSDVTVTGNTVRDAALGGIFIATNPASPGPIKGIAIAGNVVESSYTGIELADATGAAVAGNVVRGTTAADGINVDSCDGVAVTGNAVDSAWRKGIAVLGSNAQSRHVTVVGNSITRSNRGTIASAAGIHFSNTTYSMTSGNLIADETSLQAFGVLEDGGSSNNRIGPDLIRGASSGRPMAISSATTYVVRSYLSGVSADRGDASVTLTSSDVPVQRWATTLTANRTVTLPAVGMAHGDRFRIVRTGLGAFTLDVGGLKTIPSGTAAWVEVQHDGTAWRLIGYGVL